MSVHDVMMSDKMISLELKFHVFRSEADIITLKKRYPTMYIPSDFFTSRIRWCETFPVTKPFTLNRPCSFHIMHKDCDSYKKNDAIIDPPDLDYTFSAKVIETKYVTIY